jgi:hypothetical protein
MDDSELPHHQQVAGECGQDSETVAHQFQSAGQELARKDGKHGVGPEITVLEIRESAVKNGERGGCPPRRDKPPKFA